jgi:hypothetical protein
MTEWRVDSKVHTWEPVGWWKRRKGARKFIRGQANPVLEFRIEKER